MRSIGLLLALAALAGCGDHATTAPVTGGVHMELQVAPAVAGPGTPATVVATASNDGVTRIREDGCNYMNGMAAEFRDPAGTRVYLDNPLFRPLCPEVTTTFERGRKIEARWSFDGELWDATGQSMHAASGDYTVIVRFATYVNAQRADPQSIEQQATIHWVVP